MAMVLLRAPASLREHGVLNMSVSTGMHEAIPLSLYIHYPWCVRKCPYCDFNSHSSEGEIPEQTYLDALLADLEQHLGEIWGRRIDTIFIGGGTPSLISPEGMDFLLTQLRVRLPIRPDIEITMEANPGTIEQGRFAAFRQAGINRLSIGIQSFDDDKLRALGRVHDGRQARAAIASAQQAGFDNLNLDLMFGLPGQDANGAVADLEQAINAGAPHLSWYQLTIEPNTAFAHRPPSLPDEDQLWAIQCEGEASLSAAGFTQYEISAWSQAGSRCRHNMNYWQFADYLGIGAGAHGKLTRMDTQSVSRHWKQRHPQRYMETAAGPDVLAGSRQLDQGDLLLEFMMNALRLEQGFSQMLFEQRTGLSLEYAAAALQKACDRGLLIWQGDQIRPSEMGRRHLNQLLAYFMPEEE